MATAVKLEPAEQYDAIIIGAGIAGMYQLIKLRELGCSVRVFETGDGVGGTWYWNRYPGARFDSESYSYGYSFSEELLQEWEWSEHFSPQSETLRYLNHVADKFDLRRDIQFNTRVTAAHYSEADSCWTVTTDTGTQARARFLITAVGPLSAATLPAIEGIDSFKGES
ncbi:MAG TPA: NAD(P)/FAD-dependent oxidoreductase, partial [Pseudomonadales bacterium]|nr:NAD(P)/FAD-dependent oxidoreductase [Pseudomonadales bacterium]